MKKILIALLAILTMSWLFPSCEKEIFDVNPTMEDYFSESTRLGLVTIDSVQSFSNKVDAFTRAYPQALEHEKYPAIKENIKKASLRITITINDEWEGDTLIRF